MFLVYIIYGYDVTRKIGWDREIVLSRYRTCQDRYSIESWTEKLSDKTFRNELIDFLSEKSCFNCKSIFHNKHRCTSRMRN